MAPSATYEMSSFTNEKYHARNMSSEEIESAIRAFGEATRRAIEAGFDGVEIHGANHYLLHQFVSRTYNRRADEWKADLKFPLAVVDEVLRVVKLHATAPFIVGYRFSPEDPEDTGISMEQTEALVQSLVERKLDYLHVSLFDLNSKVRRGQYAGRTRIDVIQHWVGDHLPLIGIGSIFSADQALSALDYGIAFVGLGRELLLDPRFVEKIQAGKESEVINFFDPDREDKHELPEYLWKQFRNGMYPLPKKQSNDK